MMWRNVKDELPKKNGRYLCYYKSGYFSGIMICKFAINLEQVDKYDFCGDNRSGWYNYDSEYGYCECEDITHWMELPPDPYEGV